MARLKQVNRVAVGGAGRQKNMARIVAGGGKKGGTKHTAKKATGHSGIKLSLLRSPSKRSSAPKRTKGLPGRTKASKARSADLHVDEWCCSCHEGGTLHVCQNAKCPLVYCAVCLRLKDNNNDDGIDFTCPDCYVKQWEIGRRKGKVLPRYPFQLRPAQVRYPTAGGVNTERLLVLTFSLKSTIAAGSVSAVVMALLRPYFKDDQEIVHIDVPFDISTTEELTLHVKRLKACLKDVSLHLFRRCVCVFTTHCDHNTGLLFYAENACNDFNEVWEYVVGEKLTTYLGSISTTMVLLTCGNFSANAENMSVLKQVTSKEGYQNIKIEEVVLFGAPGFHPISVATFVGDYLSQVLLFRQDRRSTLTSLIQGRPQIGAHASVFHVLEGSCTKLTWAPLRSRPYGIPLPLNCGKCGIPRLPTLKKKSSTRLLYRCDFCRAWSARPRQDVEELPQVSQLWIREVL